MQVSFSGFKTTKAYIQRFGRARKAGSECYLFENDVDQATHMWIHVFNASLYRYEQRFFAQEKAGADHMTSVARDASLSVDTDARKQQVMPQEKTGPPL